MQHNSATTKPRSRRRTWSYSTGEKGVNRVRVFERGAKGLYLEWFEPGPQPASPRKRVRMALGAIDRETAKAKADEIAARFRRADPEKPKELTLEELFDIYEREVSPTKSPSKRAHDQRCHEMFLRYYGRHRKVNTLSRVDCDRFIMDRRSGRIAPRLAAPCKTGRSCVGNRVIAYDLKHLIAVLNWATVAGNGQGGVLLERNPLKGIPLPKEESPARPIISAEQYEKLREVAAAVHPQFELFLVLAHETGHRASSIRQLRWSDIDMERATVSWRAEADKIGFAHTTPLTDEALRALKAARRADPVIGDAWVFPAPRDSGRPLPRHTAIKWWKRACTLAKVPTQARLGWHAVRRQFASELKDAPLRDLAYLGGWKNPQTVLTVYQQPDEDTQRRALAGRRSLRAG